jgi:hypothetical protein
MLEILFFLCAILLGYAAWEDWKYREYETPILIFIMLLTMAIFDLSYKSYLPGDTYAVVLYLLVTFGLLVIKKIGIGDLALLPMFLIAPFNFVVALLISSLLIMPIAQYGHKVLGNKTPIINAPLPFLTIMFVMFFLVTCQMYYKTNDWFWHICVDMSQNTNETKCTFIGLEQGYYNATNPNDNKIDFSQPLISTGS